jgi:hypothetical protein
MQKRFFFPGPCKSGTTFLYNYLKQAENISVIGEKETYFYKADAKTCERRLKNYQEDEIITAFDHNAIFDDQDLHKLKKLGFELIIPVRDPIKQIISRAQHDLRVGLFSVVDFTEAKSLDHLDERIRYRSDYLSMFQSIENTGISAHFIDFVNLKNQNKLETSLAMIFGVNPIVNYKSIKNKNSSHALRFKWIVKLLRRYVRPALYRIGLGMLWSSGKQSFILRFFKTKSDENEKVKVTILENEDFANLLCRHNKFLERIKLT